MQNENYKKGNEGQKNGVSLHAESFNPHASISYLYT